MYGRNVYGTTKYGSERGYGFIYVKYFADTVTNVDILVKKITKIFVHDSIANTDRLSKKTVKIAKETVSSLDSIITTFKSSYRKTKGYIKAFLFTRSTKIRGIGSNTRIH